MIKSNNLRNESSVAYVNYTRLQNCCIKRDHWFVAFWYYILTDDTNKNYCSNKVVFMIVISNTYKKR